jgi:catechol 2,3-dioxygenase-like lactoylglutathione lyase family enzyme
MLSTSKLTAFVGVRDPDRAKQFYRDTLGLTLVSEELLGSKFYLFWQRIQLGRAGVYGTSAGILSADIHRTLLPTRDTVGPGV